jgi:hypothetical protein
MKIIPGVGLIASAGALVSVNDCLLAAGGRRDGPKCRNAPAPEMTRTKPSHRRTSWGRNSVIVEDSAPPGALAVTADEPRRELGV